MNGGALLAMPHLETIGGLLLIDAAWSIAYSHQEPRQV